MTNEELVTRIKAGIDVADNMLTLYQQNKPYISKQAGKYSGYADVEDLEQEGYLALYDAVDGYKPELGFKFLTYAKKWIKQRMARYIQRTAPVHLPANEWAKVREYNKMVNAFRVHLGRKPTRHEIAYNMGLSLEQVKQIEKSVRMGQIGSLDVNLLDEGEGTLADMVPADVDIEGEVLDGMETEELRERLWMVVDSLPGEQPQIIRDKYQKNMTLEQIGIKLGVNREKVRRLEAKALRELRYSDMGACAFLPDTIGSQAYYGGVEQFNRTWTSSTERVALMINE